VGPVLGYFRRYEGYEGNEGTCAKLAQAIYKDSLSDVNH